MRALRIAALVAAALGGPAFASAQTTAYICTPDAQVLKQIVNADGTSGGTTVWYTGNKKEAFDDCVVGPDEWLYIASGSSILRLSLSSPTPTGGAAVLSLVGSAARGLAFNVTTLYINTATTGVYTLAGVAGASDPLSFPDAATQLLTVTPENGHGIAFDVLGSMVLAAGTDVLRAPVNLVAPFYTTAPASLLTRGNTVFGTAVNTCGQIVYADKKTHSIRARAKGGTESTLATFANPADYPIALEIDSNNRMYVVTAQSDTGSNAKLWRVAGSLSNSCAGATPSLLADLSTLLSGTSKLKGLLSARALGIAVARTDASLTRDFGSGQCSQLFDFGYHNVRLTFTDCSVPFSVTVDALKSKPTDVSFDPALGTGLEGLRYSPMGGYIVQYVLNDPFPDSENPYSAQYGFAAQETLATPGIAKAAAHAPSAPFTDNVISDFWDVGALDPFAGDRGNDFSKRVLFNSPLATSSTTCTISLADYGQPFNSQNPLYKTGQTIVISFIGKDSITGAPCGGGGTMRVSVLRISPPPLALQLTQSAGGAQVDNIMSNQGHKYWFNLDSSSFGAGDFQITVWGDKFAPINRTFTIQQ